MPLDITRRDFLGGTALTIAAGLTPLDQLRADGRYYPPALTGLRGSHPGAFEVAHRLAREGEAFAFEPLPVEEEYDLVVVGGGISGLAAAWFYREAFGDAAKILILENHDDFGGHAKRNEFTVDGHAMLIGYGGSEAMEAPKANFSDTVNRVLKTLGVETSRFDTAYDMNLYGGLGLTQAVFFDRENFGADRLVSGSPLGTGADPTPGVAAKVKSIAEFVEEFPMSDDARKRLAAFLADPKDYLAGKSEDEKEQHLAKTSYRDYLIKDAGLGEEAAKFFQQQTQDYFALCSDAVPAADAMDSGYAGFDGLDLSDEEGEEEEPYIYHFPDGNASIARLLVRSLVPAAAKGSTMEDIVLADFDYSKLDQAGQPIRIRLNSTAVGVRAQADGKGAIDIGYVEHGKLHHVRAKQSVLACYNMIIPYLMPALPDAQKEALAMSVKAPLVYVNVAIRNWQAFAKLGVQQIYSPTAFFPVVKLDYPVALGGYQNPRSADEPMVLHLVHVPSEPNQGLSDVDQFRLGRAKLLEMTFDDFEKKVVDQLDRMLGAGGFQSSRDIAAITVNRWPHGYAYTFNSLFAEEPDGPMPFETARAKFGNVAIANSDAGWNAYFHEAIDQAWRAVNELKEG
jgi:spermidine dehydrogenase